MPAATAEGGGSGGEGTAMHCTVALDVRCVAAPAGVPDRDAGQFDARGEGLGVQDVVRNVRHVLPRVASARACPKTQVVERACVTVNVNHARF